MDKVKLLKLSHKISKYVYKPHFYEKFSKILIFIFQIHKLVLYFRFLFDELTKLMLHRLIKTFFEKLIVYTW